MKVISNRNLNTIDVRKAEAERLVRESDYSYADSLTSAAHLMVFGRTVSDQFLRIVLNKYALTPDRADLTPETIEFRHKTDVVAMANPFLVRMGFRPVRVTRNLMNPVAREFLIDADTPLALDPGSETYHSM